MPVDYNELFGGGAMGAHYALQDRDLEMQKQQQSIKQQQLANMFAEQDNPMRLEQQRLQNEQLGYTTKQKKLNLDQEMELAPLEMDEAKKKFILGAKKADLDLMQLEAQRMAYSPDKATSEEGQRLLSLHRDFIKLREQGEQKKELVDQRTAGQIKLEAIKQPNRVALKQMSGGGSSGAPKPLSMDKLQANYTRMAIEADAAGDEVKAKQYQNQAMYIAQQLAQRRPDTGAGKPVITPDGKIGQAPARAAPQLPSQQSKPALPSGWTMK